MQKASIYVSDGFVILHHDKTHQTWLGANRSYDGEAMRAHSWFLPISLIDLHDPAKDETLRTLLLDRLDDLVPRVGAVFSRAVVFGMSRLKPQRANELIAVDAYLRDPEKFAEKFLNQLREQHPFPDRRVRDKQRRMELEYQRSCRAIPAFLCASAQAIGTSVFVLTDRDFDTAFGSQRGNTAAFANNKGVFFDAASIADPDTVTEELVHHIDNRLVRRINPSAQSLSFTGQPAWFQASMREMRLKPTRSAESLQLLQGIYDKKNGAGTKTNTAATSWREKIDVVLHGRPLMDAGTVAIEALPDIIRMEMNLGAWLNDEGKRTDLKRHGFPEHASAEEIIRMAYPDLSRLYYGAAEGRRLISSRQGDDLQEIPADEKTPKGYTSVFAFKPLCGQLCAQEMIRNKGMSATPHPASRG